MGQDIWDRQYITTEYPYLSSKLNFRSGKRRPELKPDAVPNKIPKLTVVNIDKEDNSNTVDQNNSNIIPDHDYFQNQVNTSFQSHCCAGP